MLDCERFIECLSAYFDEELDEELLVEFREHLQFSARARTVVRTFERTIILHRRTRISALPADVHVRLSEVIRRCLERDE